MAAAIMQASIQATRTKGTPIEATQAGRAMTA